ncbi:MAG: hypothetical protein KDJ47_00345 [Hyphomicrobiaceae bacterium]|nr:hypothetical protein [Hyphomicrobiaceae bacterium]
MNEIPQNAPSAKVASLPDIPLMDVGRDFPMETLERDLPRAHQLLDLATRIVPKSALVSLDHLSRRWLARWENAHLPEIDSIAKRLGRPGAYFLSVNYEWGCTCRVAPSPDGSAARLVRVLDWRTDGLGKNIVAARVASEAGPFVTLTWPGYTGVLQAVAKGRFAAALNQAPMRKSVGYYYLDWAANRHRVWSMPHGTPAHLLRQVFETAINFEQARDMLRKTRISTPAIFSLAGLAPEETCVIERTETEAQIYDGAHAAANHWRTIGWSGHARGNDSASRARLMAGIPTEFDDTFRWLADPVLNPQTRLVMIAEPKSGRFMAQGYERDGAATMLLDAVC